MITPEHLRMARAGLGWTLADLAKHSGINPNTISRYEAGRDILSGKLHKLEETLRNAGIVFIDDHSGQGIMLSRANRGATSQSRG